MQRQDIYQMNGESSNSDFTPLQQSELHDDHKYISESMDEDIIEWNRNYALGETILKNIVVPRRNEN